jgi:hypothetical protein
MRTSRRPVGRATRGVLALPDDETLLVQHWTLSRDDWPSSAGGTI